MNSTRGFFGEGAAEQLSDFRAGHGPTTGNLPDSYRDMTDDQLIAAHLRNARMIRRAKSGGTHSDVAYWAPAIRDSGNELMRRGL